MDIRPDMSEHDYRGIVMASYSSLSLLARTSPLHLAEEIRSPREPSAAMRRGTLVHALVLEPERAKREYRIVEATTRSTKVWKTESAAAIEAGQRPVLIAEYEQACDIANAIFAARGSRDSFDNEVSIFGEYAGLGLKARVDALDKRNGRVHDIKTCKSTDPAALSRAVWTWRYHYQPAVTEIILERELDWTYWAVETSPPYDVVPYEIDRKDIDAGKQDVADLLPRFYQTLERMQCGEVVSGRADKKITVSVPAWANAYGGTPEVDND